MELWRKELYAKERADFFLAHHGIKGQRWGVKNGPPYPLNAKDHSASEKKAGWKKSLGKQSGDSSDKPKNRQNVLLSSRKAGSGEEVIFELAAYATAMAAYSFLMYRNTKKQMEREIAKQRKDLDKRLNNSPIKNIKDIPRIKGSNKAEDNVKVVNPDFPNSGSTQNCTFCTAAMAMREKGYDVKAAKTLEPMYTTDLYSMAFNAKEVKPKAKNGEALLKALASNGPGSYGNLSVAFKLGGGHSIFWKNDNGRVRIFDGQTGDEYDVSNPNNNWLMNSINVKMAYYHRLDNCQPTKYALAIVEKR